MLNDNDRQILDMLLDQCRTGSNPDAPRMLTNYLLDKQYRFSERDKSAIETASSNVIPIVPTSLPRSKTNGPKRGPYSDWSHNPGYIRFAKDGSKFKNQSIQCARCPDLINPDDVRLLQDQDEPGQRTAWHLGCAEAEELQLPQVKYWMGRWRPDKKVSAK